MRILAPQHHYTLPPCFLASFSAASETDGFVSNWQMTTAEELMSDCALITSCGVRKLFRTGNDDDCIFT
jgi:hypothetical protein